MWSRQYQARRATALPLRQWSYRGDSIRVPPYFDGPEVGMENREEKPAGEVPRSGTRRYYEIAEAHVGLDQPNSVPYFDALRPSHLRWENCHRLAQSKSRSPLRGL